MQTQVQRAAKWQVRGPCQCQVAGWAGGLPSGGAWQGHLRLWVGEHCSPMACTLSPLASRYISQPARPTHR